MATFEADLVSPVAGPFLADWTGEIDVYIGPDTGWIPAATLRGIPVFAYHQELPKRVDTARPEVRDHADRWLAAHFGVEIEGPPRWMHLHPKEKALNGWIFLGRGMCEVIQGISVWSGVLWFLDEEPHQWSKAHPPYVVIPGIATAQDPRAHACLFAGGRSTPSFPE